MSSAVQFYGKDQVMRAAMNRDCPYWAIFQLRQFLFKFEANDIKASLDMLQQTLDCIEHSTATYTIKFYEPEGKAAMKIKENTPCDGSFNFKMIEEEERNNTRQAYLANSPRVLQLLESMEQRLTAIEAAKLEEMEEVEEEPESLMGAVIGLLQQPDKLQQLIDVGKSLIGMQPTPAPRYNAVGVVKHMGQSFQRDPGPGAGHGSNLSQQQQQPTETETEEQWLIRVGNSLDVLKTRTPKLADYLEKLAAMPPAQFNSLIQMLEIMP